MSLRGSVALQPARARSRRSGHPSPAPPPGDRGTRQADGHAAGASRSRRRRAPPTLGPAAGSTAARSSRATSRPRRRRPRPPPSRPGTGSLRLASHRSRPRSRNRRYHSMPESGLWNACRNREFSVFIGSRRANQELPCRRSRVRAPSAALRSERPRSGGVFLFLGKRKIPVHKARVKSRVKNLQSRSCGPDSDVAWRARIREPPACPRRLRACAGVRV